MNEQDKEMMEVYLTKLEYEIRKDDTNEDKIQGEIDDSRITLDVSQEKSKAIQENQNKNITEMLQIPVFSSRKSNITYSLNRNEIQKLRVTIGQLNWLLTQT